MSISNKTRQFSSMFYVHVSRFARMLGDYCQFCNGNSIPFLLSLNLMSNRFFLNFNHNLTKCNFKNLSLLFQFKFYIYLCNCSAELAFKVHSLEVRLTRHKDLTAPRYRALEDLLFKHPLLKEYNRIKHYYK